MASSTVKQLSERLYPAYRSQSDRLDAMVRSRLRPDLDLLDIGCGGGKLFPYDYRGLARRVVGVDLDPALWENETLDERVHGSVEQLPFDAGSFDVAYSRYVFEHLPHPERAFAEISRVLRPGGVFVVLTPNAWHYVPLVSRLTPDSFHKFFNFRLRGRNAEDTFPTLYRANSRRVLARLARGAGMEEDEVQMLETRPNYLMWSAVPFLAGVAYERLVNATPLLRDLRVNILAAYRKPAGS